MPHDRNGTLLAIGDKVTITAEVTGLTSAEQYCNATLSLPPMPPYSTPYVLNLNTNQLVKVQEELAPEGGTAPPPEGVVP